MVTPLNVPTVVGPSVTLNVSATPSVLLSDAVMATLDAAVESPRTTRLPLTTLAVTAGTERSSSRSTVNRGRVRNFMKHLPSGG